MNHSGELTSISYSTTSSAGFGEIDSQTEEEKERSRKYRSRYEAQPLVVQSDNYRALASNLRQYVLRPPDSNIDPKDEEYIKQEKSFCNIDRLKQGVICATSLTSSVCLADRGGK